MVGPGLGYLLALALSLAACTGTNGQKRATDKLLASRLLNEAEVLHAKAQAEEAIALYQQAFHLDPWAFHAYLDAFKAALDLPDSGLAGQFLRSGARHGLKLDWYTDMPRLIDFLASPAAVDLNESLKEDEITFGSFADSAFIKVLDSLVIEDQRYRMGMFDRDKIAYVDSTNFEFLIHYFEHHGFPDARRLGHALNDLDVLLWHHRGEEYPGSPQWRRVLPFIRGAMAQGNLPPSFLARYEDYADHAAGRPMRYGALLNFLSNSPSELRFIDKAQLNDNRTTIGWCPIEEAAFLAGFDMAQMCFGL